MAAPTREQLEILGNEKLTEARNVLAREVFKGDKFASGSEVESISRKRVNVIFTFTNGETATFRADAVVPVERRVRAPQAKEAWNECMILTWLERLPDFASMNFPEGQGRREIQWNLESMVANERKAELKRVAMKIAALPDIKSWREVATEVTKELLDDVLRWSGTHSTSRSSNFVDEVNHETEIVMLKEFQRMLRV